LILSDDWKNIWAVKISHQQFPRFFGRPSGDAAQPGMIAGKIGQFKNKTKLVDVVVVVAVVAVICSLDNASNALWCSFVLAVW